MHLMLHLFNLGNSVLLHQDLAVYFLFIRFKLFLGIFLYQTIWPNLLTANLYPHIWNDISI